MDKNVKEKKTFGEWIWDKSNGIRTWWSYNKEWAIVVLPIVGAGAIWLIKKAVNVSISSINYGREKALKELYIYDRSMGNYWKLRRPLSTSEMLSIENRKKMGETLGQILSSMRVI